MEGQASSVLPSSWISICCFSSSSCNWAAVIVVLQSQCEHTLFPTPVLTACWRLRLSFCCSQTLLPSAPTPSGWAAPGRAKQSFPKAVSVGLGFYSRSQRSEGFKKNLQAWRKAQKCGFLLLQSKMKVICSGWVAWFLFVKLYICVEEELSFAFLHSADDALCGGSIWGAEAICFAVPFESPGKTCVCLNAHSIPALVFSCTSKILPGPLSTGWRQQLLQHFSCNLSAHVMDQTLWIFPGKVIHVGVFQREAAG